MTAAHEEKLPRDGVVGWLEKSLHSVDAESIWRGRLIVVGWASVSVWSRESSKTTAARFMRRRPATERARSSPSSYRSSFVSNPSRRTTNLQRSRASRT